MNSPIYSEEDISQLILSREGDLNMGLEYDKRIYIRRNGAFEHKCEACGKTIKEKEIVELLAVGNNKAWFHEDCMLPYITKLQREFLLSKI